MTQQRAHLLKNGHPAHVFTDEDRRKGAERTNAIRRARRMAFEDEKFERAIALMHARDEARRARRRERYERDKARQSVPTASPSHDQAHPGTQRARARGAFSVSRATTCHEQP